MAITADLVKDLRERIGGGSLLECKRALESVNGDIDAAVKLMRETGKAKADKKASRIAAEGVVAVVMADDAKIALMLEVNCETDFVAKDNNFRQFVDVIANAGLAAKVADVESLMALVIDGKTIANLREDLVAKIGENINVRRILLMQATGANVIGSYVHSGRIGALINYIGGDEAFGRDLAMHIVASKPLVTRESEVSADLIDKEREIYMAQVKESGKPAEIMEKMIKGRLQKFLDEIVLINQPFVKDPDKKIADLLKQNKADVAKFARFEVGEGIEKEKCDFATEVMAQVDAKKS